jgi:cell wall-associated NlpC family hydrolase
MEALGTSLDCSGFTKAVYNHYKIHLPASSTGQYSKTMRFEKEASEPGDLLFFNTSGTGISHVAISLGNNKFIHSPGKGKKVCIDSIEQLYWNKRFISGGKVNFNPLK